MLISIKMSTFAPDFKTMVSLKSTFLVKKAGWGGHCN